jgi:hypothetical protein
VIIDFGTVGLTIRASGPTVTLDDAVTIARHILG